ncbi:hypothetical protein SAMN02745181_0324 [Rubritalea squalenifaciens DSM 18772]|uniref:Uncharacterized protein n=2 Tax=Rubritalea TaxID=361050 RepID=A0A1M6BWD9_9BACT|nr:hypothetical protein [Rubritalea squalenifaciens]SHI52943.1 hypothetical protein SAMN02745181_0324 [Rubritalea squalenifaciens DSM 18772]
MQTHFTKLRRLILLSAVSTPVLSFIAFLVFAAGQEAVGLLMGLTAFLVANAFPHEKPMKDPNKESQWKLSHVLQLIPAMLVSIWLVQRPSFQLLLDDAWASLWDWRVITAAAIWHALWLRSSYRKATTLEDTSIIAIYTEPEKS